MGASKRRPAAAAKAKQQRSWAQAKAGWSNTRVSVTVPLDAHAADEAVQLERELRKLREEDGDIADRSEEIAQLAARIRELEAAAAESEMTFGFEGLGRGRYAKMLAQYPASDEQKAVIDQDLVYDPERFPPALMAASCVEPAELAGNLAEWTDIHENRSPGIVTRLWRACQQAHLGVADVPKSLLVSAVLGQQSSDDS